MLIIPFFIFLTEHTNIENEQSFCPFKMLTGLPCLGCGITKSIVCLYDGNLLKSFSYHLFGPIVVVLCFYFLIKLSLELYYKKVFFEHFFNQKKIAYSVAAILIVYHLIRIIFYLQNTTWQEIKGASIWY